MPVDLLNIHAAILHGLESVGQFEQLACGALNAQRRYRGDKPSELPIVQPTKFETAINLKAASDLGIALSPSLLASADEVIE